MAYEETENRAFPGPAGEGMGSASPAERGNPMLALVTSTLVVASMLVSAVAGVMSLRALGRYDGSVVLMFLPTLLILVVLLGDEVRRRPYSLNLIHLIGLYLFMGVAGLYQVSLGRYPLTNFSEADQGRAVVVNIAVIGWIIFYTAGYYLRRSWAHRGGGGVAGFLNREISPGRINFGLVLSFVVFAYLVVLGLGGIVTRADANFTLATQESSPLQLINKVFFRAIPYVAVLAALLRIKAVGVARSGWTLGILVLSIPFLWYADNPLAAARYWTAAVVIGLVAPTLLIRFKTAVPLLLCLVSGLAVMPALGEARHSEDGAELVEVLTEVAIPSPVIYLATSGDVGAYGVLDLTFRWLEYNDHTWGRQMLAWLFFYVPRSIWPSKPISTGAQVTGDLGFDFTIISAPIISEPLIDFGWIGLPIFAFAFGWLLCFIDETYYRGRLDDVVRRIDVIYPFMLGMTLLITRGSMMSAVAYTVGFVAASVPLYFGIPRRRRTVDIAPSAIPPVGRGEYSEAGDR